MKSLLGKRWHRIPIALVSALLILALTASGVFASIQYFETQTVTQTILEPLPEPDYGTITAPDLDLQDLYAGGQSFGSVFPNHVTVQLGPDGVDHHLWLELDASSALYAEYEIKLVCKVSADEDTVPIGTEIIVDMTNWRTSIPLGAQGAYIFDEYIHLKTGVEWGGASTSFKVAISNVPAP
ncbi:unnamed protein product [marine sediment metagenome]|uniref:Uncharacterized protein n=1 Tax=marine sediment metagenome TaxID=412755 RepID=X1INV8_9ZZZZ